VKRSKLDVVSHDFVSADRESCPPYKDIFIRKSIGRKPTLHEKAAPGVPVRVGLDPIPPRRTELTNTSSARTATLADSRRPTALGSVFRKNTTFDTYYIHIQL
jgi:hypothetical protein